MRECSTGFGGFAGFAHKVPSAQKPKALHKKSIGPIRASIPFCTKSAGVEEAPAKDRTGRQVVVYKEISKIRRYSSTGQRSPVLHRRLRPRVYRPTLRGR